MLAHTWPDMRWYSVIKATGTEVLYLQTILSPVLAHTSPDLRWYSVMKPDRI
jgi:hypothetical protein